MNRRKSLGRLAAFAAAVGRNVLLFSVLLAGIVCPTAWADATLSKTDLFTAGQNSYALYRIPGLIVTSRGTLLACCEARRTGKSDWGAIDILLRRSTDGGKSWSAPQKISDISGPKTRNPVIAGYKPAKPDDLTYNNPVLIAGRDGTVHLLFCLEYMRCFHLRSEDDGVTWFKPVEITSTFLGFPAGPEWSWKVIATGPAHGIQLKNGRLIVPVWLSSGEGGGNGHRPSSTGTIFSDDHGKTWQSGQIAVPNTEEWINPNETIVVELTEGRVLLNVRTESKANRRLITTSKDGATGWSKPRFDDALLEPICMASIVRLSEKPDRDKNRIVFANPDNLSRADGKTAPGKSRDRKNLSIKVTYDEGETWPVNKVLEAGTSGYSDLAVAKDGTILCLYESSRHLTLARFNLEWLTDGKDVGR